MKRAVLMVLALLPLTVPTTGFEVRVLEEVGPASITRWAASDIPVPYVIDSKGSADVPFTQTSAAVEESFRTWQDITKQFWRFSFAGVRSPAIMNTTDRVNSVLWIEKNWPFDPAILAITRLSFFIQETPTFTDADIMFNGEDHRWSVNPEPGKESIAAIAHHEVGHFVGLKHSQVKGSTMLPSGSGAVPLSKDEKAGIRFLYPPSPLSAFKTVSPRKQARIVKESGSGVFPFLTFRWTTPAGFTNFVVEFCPARTFSPAGKVKSFAAGNASFLVETTSIRSQLLRLAGTERKLFWRVRADSTAGPQTTTRSIFIFEQ